MLGKEKHIFLGGLGRGLMQGGSQKTLLTTTKKRSIVLNSNFFLDHPVYFYMESFLIVTMNKRR